MYGRFEPGKPVRRVEGGDDQLSERRESFVMFQMLWVYLDAGKKMQHDHQVFH